MSTAAITHSTSHHTCTPPLVETGTRSLRPIEPIQIRAQETLANADYLELRCVTCEYFGGILTLQGTVGSFFLKQMAQESLRGLDGVRYIANAIRVTDN